MRERDEKHSLIEQILQIQDFERSNLKSFRWMKRLLCLSIHNPSSPIGPESHGPHTDPDIVLYEVCANLFDTQYFQYATISYASRPAPTESNRSASYLIVKLDGSTSQNIVRDTIMRRAIGYAEHHKLRGFWIDDQCLDQDDPKRRDLAIHSMDRLYAQSPYSVGMLTILVDDQWKLDALYSLMDGSVFEAADGASHAQVPPRLRPIRRFWRVVRWFFRLLSDPWWSRCWIFQEEYCAARNMWILIPCNLNLHRRSSLFGTIRDEIQILAMDLRTQFTLFGLACQHDPRLNSREKHSIQRRLLCKVERYQTSYQLGRNQGHTLSSKIMADLQRRHVKYPQDLLAISANCCNYARRLDQRALDREEGISLTMSLLVQALLNGEILQNELGPQLRARGFAQFFRQHIFHKVQPPVGMDNLTFGKHCRFQGVQLCREGIITRGYLWRVSAVLQIRGPQSKYSIDSVQTAASPSASLWECLQEFAEELERSYPQIANQLSQFVSEMAALSQFGARAQFMIAMAKEVARAWSERRPLIVGHRLGHSLDCAIFVPADERSLPRQVFTWWYNASERKWKDSLEPMDKHVLFEVERNPYAEPDLPRLRIKQWINGLCFFAQSVSQRVLFPWPDSFLVA